MHRATCIFTTLILFLTTFPNAATAHSNEIPNARRHSTPQSQSSKKVLPRRGNPLGAPEALSSSSRLSQLAESLRKRALKKEGKRDPKLGPGAGPDGVIAAENRRRRRAAREAAGAGASPAEHALEKRQQSSSGSATATSSAPVASASTNSTGNSTEPTWILNDVYAGNTFWNYFSFFTGADPTNGPTDYVNASIAFSEGLAYNNAQKQVIMKADNTTSLQLGEFRKSPRIQSYKTYTGGLFVLDVEKTPYGCGVWPAFWTVGSNWPSNGEIDVYEGVHLSTNNQVTWHTTPGCTLKPGGFFGRINSTDCNTAVNSNAGCAVTDQSYSSSGATLQAIGGGVYAMQWDDTGISVWFFPRPTVPNDVTDLDPDPTTWGEPMAHLSPDDCDVVSHFADHVIVFNIAFCGDWAGATYLTSGCPGTCNAQIMDPSNFDESYWIINSLRVYTNAYLQAGELSAALPMRGRPSILGSMAGLGVAAMALASSWL
ncbi:hypothetical protein FRB98_004000 [Tulasnella sp. 332]|nr:hypothetical protein FRB98_004000 [Tulasnella sp. 332]